jgi:DNA-binding transcriptional ArsR family regulator
MGNYYQPLDTTFQALADPTRRAVVGRLVSGPASVSELARPFAMGLPALMKHLRVLEDSGLIGSRKTGRVRVCHLNLPRLAGAEAWLAEQRNLWEARTDRLAEYVEREMREGNDQ